METKTVEMSVETWDKIKEQVLNEEKLIKEKTVKKLEIKNRFTGKVQIISTKETFRDAVIENKYNLSDADLRETNLIEANLIEADLRFADLRFANLQYADLRSADLQYADLQYANLRFANLQYADLGSADLRSANLRFADLRSADLRSTDLRSADLRSAERTDYKLKKNPIMLYGFKYPVLIFDKHMEIGCRAYTFAEWENFSLKEIEDIGGPDSRKMWRKYKTMLLDLCKKMRYK